MVKSAVRVCVRTRPTAAFAHTELVVKPEDRTIDVNIKKNPNMGVVNNMRENYGFKFDHILHNSSQDTVYAEAVSEITKSIVQGYNGSVLVYGQTGAGKTYTMSGGQGDYKARGMIPRAIQEIFTEVNSRPDTEFNIRMSYLEIYNEQLYDLLSPTGFTKQDGAEDLLIVEDSKGHIQVKGLMMPHAASEEEAMNLFFEGETNRAIAEHQLNAASSRSHCILTIYVESRSRVESADRMLSSKLNLVDLAGSERVSKTHSTGLLRPQPPQSYRCSYPSRPRSPAQARSSARRCTSTSRCRSWSSASVRSQTAGATTCPSGSRSSRTCSRTRSAGTAARR